MIVACGKEKKSSDHYHRSEDLKMNAAIFGNQIQLSNFISSVGTSSVCGPSPMAGKIYNYSLMGDVLSIADQNVQVSYQREINGGGIYGLWKMISSTDTRMTSGTLEITSTSVHFISSCSQ
jgi:hypothetical protein